MILTASDLASMTRCEHRVYLDRFGDSGEQVPYPEFLQILWESGRLHEDEVISGLEYVTPAGSDGNARFESSVSLMSAGEPLIYHAFLRTGALAGEPDLLKRVEQPSLLGTHSYIPVEIKAGRAWDNLSAKKLKAKPHYIAQLCVYAEILGSIQGVTPTTGYIVDAEGEWVLLDLMEFWAEYEQLREIARQFATGSEVTAAAKKKDCDLCVWFEVCDRDLRGRDDVTLVAGVGQSAREKMWQVGVKSGSQLARADPALLVTVKGIGQSSAEKWIRQARVQKGTEPEIRKPWSPPHSAFDVSYDIEDFMFGGSVYLHGLLVRPTGATPFGSSEHSLMDWGQYDAICSVAGEAEEAVWHRFLARIEEIDGLGEYAVYVYSSHEQTHLTKLRARYGSSAALDRFATRFVDLYEVVRDCFVFPTEGTGLKDIATFCGFSWRDSNPGGSQSIAWWANYLKDPTANAYLRDRVIAYNEDDVRASLAVRDWMKKTGE